MPTTRDRIAELTARADAQTEQRLRDAHGRYQRALQELELAQNARTDEIRRALEEGWTQRRIAEIFGVTRGRVSQWVSS